MANRVVDVAKEAFASANYQLAVDLFEQIVRLESHTNETGPNHGLLMDAYFGYADSLARTGNIKESFDIYATICSRLGHGVPLDRLKHLTIGLLDYVSLMRCNNITFPTESLLALPSNKDENGSKSMTNNENNNTDEITEPIDISGDCLKDPLACPVCEDVLIWPVTTVCGHTFCRQCSYSQALCVVCGQKFLMYSDNFKQDVLISRLVEKWWSAEIQAQLLNLESKTYLQQNLLDDALKACNASLEKCPTNYESLSIRSKVLLLLNHYQSSLADADSAIRSRPTSYKAHLNRAKILSKMGVVDEALISHCLSASLNTTLSSYSTNVRQEISKLIQQLLLPTSSEKSLPPSELVYYPKGMKRCRYRQFTYFSPIGQSNERTNVCDTDFFSSSNYDTCADNNELFAPYNGVGKALRISQLRRKRRGQMRHQRYDCAQNDSSETINISSVSNRMRNVLDRTQFELSKIGSGQTKGTRLEVNSSLIDISDFDCVLCYRTLWKPVVTPCGHTYCTVCLDRCLDYSSCCPLCKSSLIDEKPPTNPSNQFRNRTQANAQTNHPSFSVSKKSITQFIETAMKRFIPAAYKKRQMQEIENEPSVPVFICTTAFPNVPCPLYVYEPRHRLMIRRAIENGDRQFGIVQPHVSGIGYSDFGTMLDIRDCVLLGNGCSILSTVGCRRFRVVDRNEKDGYDIAKVEYIYDEKVSSDRRKIIRGLNYSVFRKAFEWYDSLPAHIHHEIQKSFGCMPTLEKNWEAITDGPAWAWYIIALLPLNQNLKVEILATTDLEKRLRAIDKTLEYVAAQQRRSVCVVSCEGLQQCQAIDCCLRASSSNHLDETPAPTHSHVTEYLL